MNELIVVTVGLFLISLFFKRRYLTVFNPPTLYSFSFFLSALAVIVSTKIAEIAENEHLANFLDPQDLAYIYAAGVGCFILPWLRRNPFLKNSIFAEREDVKDQRQLITITKVVGVFLLISLIVAMLMLGRIPFLEMVLNQINIDDHLTSLNSLPLGLMAIIAWTHILLTLYLSSLIRFKSVYSVTRVQIISLILILVLSGLWQGNRQFLLFTIYILIARWYQESTSSLSVRDFIRLFLVAAIFITVFFYIGSIRLLGQGASPYDLFGYLTWPAFNLLAIISNSPNVNTDHLPNYLLREIVPHRLLDFDSLNLMKSNLFEPTSSSGYLSYWYLDYGYLGVCLGSFALGWYSYKVFKNRNENEGSMRLNMLVSWVCITSAVYGHFLSLNFFLMPVFLLYLINKLFPEIMKTKREPDESY